MKNEKINDWSRSANSLKKNWEVRRQQTASRRRNKRNDNCDPVLSTVIMCRSTKAGHNMLSKKYKEDQREPKCKILYDSPLLRCIRAPFESHLLDYPRRCLLRSIFCWRLHFDARFEIEFWRNVCFVKSLSASFEVFVSLFKKIAFLSRFPRYRVPGIIP